MRTVLRRWFLHSEGTRDPVWDSDISGTVNVFMVGAAAVALFQILVVTLVCVGVLG